MTEDDRLAGLRVLLVEDEILVVMMLEDMLDELGCEVVATAAKVGDALRVLDRVEIDAAVLDINLDGESSFELADGLADRGIPFVFSTGYSESRLEERHRHRPSLKKPFEKQQLCDALVGLGATRDGPGS